jgi:hypothetical protein
MDLTRQPPRRPSNATMAGIVGLARLIDKARGHNAELIGEFKYGPDSGLDCEVLELLGISADDFADAAGRLWDEEMVGWVTERMTCSQADIDAFNAEQLARTPQDELHERLLKERIEKYAPGRTDITTVYASIELDDWGAFREKDLTVEPPRTGFLKSVAGLTGAARMADKARAHKTGKLGDYKYGDDSYIDRAILEFLGLTAEAFAEGAWQNPNDAELSEWIGERASFTKGAATLLNDRLSRHGMGNPEFAERFRARRDEICPDRPEVTTYLALMDIDDEQSFGIVDLTRRPPRSPYDTMGGVLALPRMIDKGRAHNAGLLGGYWYGEDSGFDRRILEFLGLSAEEFAAGLAQHATDEAVESWLGDRLDRDATAVNEALVELSPSDAAGRTRLAGGFKSLDPARHDLNTFMALSQLDDELFLARLRTRV